MICYNATWEIMSVMIIEANIEIKTLQDIKNLLMHLCLSNYDYTKEDLFNTIQDYLKDSVIIINKKLRLLIDDALDFLVRYQLVNDNQDGTFSKVVKKETTDSHML